MRRVLVWLGGRRARKMLQQKWCCPAIFILLDYILSPQQWQGRCATDSAQSKRTHGIMDRRIMPQSAENPMVRAYRARNAPAVAQLHRVGFLWRMNVSVERECAFGRVLFCTMRVVRRETHRSICSLERPTVKEVKETDGVRPVRLKWEKNTRFLVCKRAHFQPSPAEPLTRRLTFLHAPSLENVHPAAFATL